MSYELSAIERKLDSIRENVDYIKTEIREQKDNRKIVYAGIMAIILGVLLGLSSCFVITLIDQHNKELTRSQINTSIRT